MCCQAIQTVAEKAAERVADLNDLFFALIAGLHTLRDHRALMKWLHQQVQPYGIEVTNLSSSWSSGMALCALIHRYRPDLM